MRIRTASYLSFALALGENKRMLSLDQVLRLISVPAIVAAFLIALQISGAGILHTSAQAHPAPIVAR